MTGRHSSADKLSIQCLGVGDLLDVRLVLLSAA